MSNPDSRGDDVRPGQLQSAPEGGGGGAAVLLREVERRREDSLSAAIEALREEAEAVQAAGDLPRIKSLRNFEPGQRVHARLEISTVATSAETPDSVSSEVLISAVEPQRQGTTEIAQKRPKTL